MSAFEERLDARFGQIDTRFGQIDVHFAQIDARFGQIDARFGQIDARFGQIDTQFGQIDTQFDNLAQSMKIQFEDVRREIRFSLEAVVGLREVTERELGSVRAEHRDQTSLIHDVLRHVHS